METGNWTKEKMTDSDDLQDDRAINASEEDSDEETVSSEPVSGSLDPRLLRKRSHVSLLTFFKVVTAGICLAAITLPLIYWLGGSVQLWKAASAYGLAGLASILGMLVLLKPVDSLNFIGLVYFSVLIRMGLGLGTVFVMRQIDTPLFGKDWVGYLIFYYSSVLLVETVLVVQRLNSPIHLGRECGAEPSEDSR